VVVRNSKVLRGAQTGRSPFNRGLKKGTEAIIVGGRPIQQAFDVAPIGEKKEVGRPLRGGGRCPVKREKVFTSAATENIEGGDLKAAESAER